MLTSFGTHHHYNDLNMAEGMRARVHLQFYGIKLSYKINLYLLEILCEFLDKHDQVMYLVIVPVVIKAARY